MATIWKSLKVFISSTFLDLELARDEIHDIFLRVEQDILARQLTIKPYDLRWRDRHEEESLVEWCHKMVEQCEYFVGVLGERYGWRPDFDIEGKTNENQMSITEMEFREACKNLSPSQRFFCLQKSLGKIESEEDKNSLEALRSHLENEEERIFYYENTSELIEIVERELRKQINRDYPPGAKVAAVEHTRKQALVEIIEEKIRSFVGRQSYLDQMKDFVDKQNSPNYLVIQAVAGTGKSALLTKFIREQEGNSTPLVAHFLGMGANANTSYGILSSLAEQLAEKDLLNEDLAKEETELQNQVHSALQENLSPLILLIDGLDEGDDEARELRWLPVNLPESTLAILSTRPVDTWDNLNSRYSFTSWELPPLNDKEIQTLIQNYAQQHKLEISSTDYEVIQQRAAGNPLYLKVALDEISASGMAVGQLALSIESLFQQVLERLSRKYGEELAHRFLGLIAASRFGLLEQELSEMLQEDDTVLFSLSKAFDNFLVRRRGLINFFHPEFERAIKMRMGRGGMRYFHQEISSYLFLKSFAYHRSLDELPYQLQWAEDHEKLLSTLTDIEFLEKKCQAGLFLSLKQDFNLALHGLAIRLPENIKLDLGNGFTLTHRHVYYLARAIENEFRFLDQHPESLFAFLWNLCYWHDHSESQGHYLNWAESSPPETQLHRLVENWERKKSPSSFWLKSKRPLPQRLDSPLLRIFRGHHQAIESAVFNAKGNKIASVSWDQTVRIWNAQTGQMLHLLSGHEGWVFTVDFHPDKEIVASGSKDKTIKIWDAEKGTLLSTLDGHEKSVSSLHFSPDGRFLASGSQDNSIVIWDLQNKTVVARLEGHEKNVLAVSFSPDNNYIASGSLDKTVRLWDVKKTSLLHVFEGHQSSVEDVCFSPDGRLIASASLDQTARIWEVESKREIHCFTQHRDRVYSIAFQPSGKEVASGSLDKTIQIWNPKTGAVSRILSGHEKNVISLDFNEKGTELVSAGGGDKTIRLWDLSQEDKTLRLEGHDDKVTSVHFDSSGQHILSTSRDNRIGLWDVASGKIKRFFEGHEKWVSDALFLPDGKFISAGYDKKICFWDFDQNEPFKVLLGHRRQVTSLALHPQGDSFISGSSDSTIKWWSYPQGNETHTFTGHESAVTSVAFSHDGRSIASASKDDTLRVWDLATGEEKIRLDDFQHTIYSIAFSPNGQEIITCALNGKIKTWNLEEKKATETITGLAPAETIASLISPFYSVASDWQTVVLRKKDQAEVAYFPGAIEGLTFSSQGVMAGYSGNHLCLFELIENND